VCDCEGRITVGSCGSSSSPFAYFTSFTGWGGGTVCNPEGGAGGGPAGGPGGVAAGGAGGVASDNDGGIDACPGPCPTGGRSGD